MKGSLIALLVLAVGLASDSLNIVDKVSNYYIKQNTTKEIELTKMFHYTNMEKMLNNMSEQMLLNMKLNNPELTKDKKFEEYMKNTMSVESFKRMYLKVYAKHYTLEEIIKINEIYSSDEMQKFFKLGPQIATDLANEMAVLLQTEINKMKNTQSR